MAFFGKAARSRQGLAVAAALVASSGLIALAVVSTATRRSELAAVYPPYASSFGVRPQAKMQVCGLTEALALIQPLLPMITSRKFLMLVRL